MIQIDGKTVDLTNPQTWGNSIEIKPNGFIEQTKDGVTTLVEPTPQPLKEAQSATITSLTERITALEGK
jgi:hypothetical protein